MADFCMWSSSETNDTVAESEAREVVWCTGPGHGTRIIPPGAITGAQWLYAKDYLQVVGFIDQAQVNIQTGDYGGEMDPHGADLVSPRPSATFFFAALRGFSPFVFSNELDTRVSVPLARVFIYSEVLHLPCTTRSPGCF